MKLILREKLKVRKNKRKWKVDRESVLRKSRPTNTTNKQPITKEVTIAAYSAGKVAIFIELNKVELLLLLLYRQWLPLFEKIIPSVVHHYSDKRRETRSVE